MIYVTCEAVVRLRSPAIVGFKFAVTFMDVDIGLVLVCCHAVSGEINCKKTVHHIFQHIFFFLYIVGK